MVPPEKATTAASSHVATHRLKPPGASHLFSVFFHSGPAIATIEAIEQENMLANATQMGQYVMTKLEGLKQKHSCIDEIRGVGLMLGIQLNEPGAEIVKACWKKALRINCTHETVLRMMPAMNVTAEQLDTAIGILDEALSEVA